MIDHAEPYPEMPDNLPLAEPKPICQYCLADPRYTGLGELGKSRCPVCGAPYSGPRRDAEYRVLVEAGLVACGD